MAIRIWNSTGSTNMNLSSNYTGTGELLPTDDIVFNNTSQISASSVAPLIINSITTSSNYTGVFTQGSYPITSTTSIDLNHSGSLVLGGPITITSSGDFTLGSKMTSFDCTNLELSMLDHGTISFVKTPLTISKLDVSYPNKTVILGALTPSGGGLFINNCLELNGGSFYYNTITYSITNKVYPSNANSCLRWHPNTTFVNSSKTNTLALTSTFSSNTPLNFNIPFIKILGSGVLSFNITNPSGNVLLNQTGDITSPSIYITSFNSNSNTIVYRSNGFKLFASGYGVGTAANFNDASLIALTHNNTSNQITYDFSNSDMKAEVFQYAGSSLSGVLKLTNANIDIKASTPNYGFIMLTRPLSYNTSGSMISVNVPSGIVRTNTMSLSRLNILSNNVIFSGALVADRIVMPGTTTRFTSVSGFAVSYYVNGDWDNCTIKSSINGSNGPVTVPSGMLLYNVLASGCTFSSPIFTYNCRNIGGSTNLVFPSSTKTSDRSSIVSRLLRR